MKRSIILTGAAAVVVSASIDDGDWGNWGDGNWGSWGKGDSFKNCIGSDWSSPDAVIESACGTGTITASPAGPTILDCFSSEFSDWIPATKWDSISSKVNSACSAYSSCKTEPDAKTYTLTYDGSWWSDSDWAPTKTADVVTFTGCAGGWDSFLPGWGGDWDGNKDDDWGSDWDGKDGDWDDKDGDWNDDKDGDGKSDDDWKDYCDDKGEWKRDGDWSSDYSYSCVSVTSTITNGNGVVSTVVAAVPTTFLAATASNDNGAFATTSPDIPPAGAAATAAVGMLAGAVVGVGMLMAV
jgi:hypothetical protein